MEHMVSCQMRKNLIRYKAIEKKGSKGSNTEKRIQGVPELLVGLRFSITRCQENEMRKVMFQNSKIETKGSEIENDDSKLETGEWTEVHHRRKQ